MTLHPVLSGLGMSATFFGSIATGPKRFTGHVTAPLPLSLWVSMVTQDTFTAALTTFSSISSCGPVHPVRR